MKGYVVCVYKSISSEEKLKEYAVKRPDPAPRNPSPTFDQARKVLSFAK